MRICPECKQRTLDYRPVRGEFRCVRDECGYARLAETSMYYRPAPLGDQRAVTDREPPRVQAQGAG